ncbi:MAG: hypothetical protein AMXMBFR7_04010 [Planctomycetota bacterium]
MIASASAYRAPEFETLMARFFDGVLTEAEDRAFSELLAASPERAKRFLEQVRMERALGGAVESRIESDAFVAAVMRGVKLAQDGSDTERFARIVAKQARGVSQRRMASRRSRASLRARRAEAAPGAALWLPVLGAAALVSLVILLGGSPESDRSRTGVAKAPGTAESPDRFRPSRYDYAIPVPDSEPSLPSEFESPTEQPAPPFEPDALVQTDTEPGEPVEAESKPALVDRPDAPEAIPVREPGRLMARVQRLVGVRAKLRAADGERDLVERQALSSGETLILKLDAGATPADGQSGAELALEDGTTIWLNPDSALRFDAQGVAVLEAGSLAFRVAGPAQAEAWKLRVDSGPQVAAKSAAARVRRDAANRRVVVLVDEGRAEISNLGAREVVVANHGCVSPFQSTPGSPYLFQTLKGSGIVTQPPPSAMESGGGARESSTGETAGAVPAPESSGTGSEGSGAGTGPNPGKTSGNGAGAGKTGGSGNTNPPGAGNGSGSGASKTGGSGNGTPPGAGGSGAGSGTGAGSGNGSGRGPSGGTPPGAGSGRTGAGSGTGGTGRGSGAGSGGGGSGSGRGSGSPPPKSGGPKAGKGGGIK